MTFVLYMYSGDGRCEGCCDTKFKSEYQGRDWSLVDNSTIENEKINVGYCMPRGWWFERCWCCIKDQKCYEDPDACHKDCA